MDLITWTPGGQPLRAYVARPPAPGPAAVVLHSAWGLRRDYLEMCDRLAGVGFLAVAPDLFNGRTAGSWAEAEQLAEEHPSITLVPAAASTVQWLRAQPGVSPARVALLGFSLGGVTALRAAAAGAGDAVVTFYGTPALEIADSVRLPVLGHFAETDEYEPAPYVADFFAALRRQGTPASLVTYPGTGHCFVEPTIDTYDEAAAEQAWSATLDFLRQHLA